MLKQYEARTKEGPVRAKGGRVSIKFDRFAVPGTAQDRLQSSGQSAGPGVFPNKLISATQFDDDDGDAARLAS